MFVTAQGNVTSIGLFIASSGKCMPRGHFVIYKKGTNGKADCYYDTYFGQAEGKPDLRQYSFASLKKSFGFKKPNIHFIPLPHLTVDILSSVKLVYTNKSYNVFSGFLEALTNLVKDKYPKVDLDMATRLFITTICNQLSTAKDNVFFQKHIFNKTI